MPGLRAGRTATVIPADFSYFADMIQNAELRSPCPSPTFHPRLGLHSSLTRRERHFFASDKCLQFLFCQLPQASKVSHLHFQCVIDPIEPETAAVSELRIACPRARRRRSYELGTCPSPRKY